MQESNLLDTFGENLLKIASKHKGLVVLDSTFSSFSKTSTFAKSFADRYFRFGCASRALVATSSGFAVRGKLPFVCADAHTLAGQAYSEVRNLLCYPNMNVKLVGFNAGLALGQDGALSYALDDIALMRSIPNMKIFTPADASELKYIMAEMLSNFGPVYLRLDAGATYQIYEDAKCTFTSGKAEVLKKGKDICVFASGTMLEPALKAAFELKEDISVMVVNVASIKPLDEKLILSVASKVKLLVSVEEHSTTGGLGSALTELLSEKYPTRLHRVGIEGFCESGLRSDLFAKYALDVNGIVKTLKKLVIHL